jgi:hypothetical protein
MSPGTGFFMKFPTFADNDYVEKYQLAADTGRFTVTGEEADRSMWKVPTLRNIALTAPNVTYLSQSHRHPGAGHAAPAADTGALDHKITALPGSRAGSTAAGMAQLSSENKGNIRLHPGWPAGYPQQRGW